MSELGGRGDRGGDEVVKVSSNPCGTVLVNVKSIKFILFFFFFSSRRRHTRCLSDWSSDVCSSDLLLYRSLSHLIAVERKLFTRDERNLEYLQTDVGEILKTILASTRQVLECDETRSEERRVGKECRYRGRQYR